MNSAIPLGVQGVKIPDPLEALGKAMTLRQLIGQQELQGLQLRQARRETDKADRLDALARKGLSMDEYLRGMREIDPLAAETAGMKWRTDRRAEVKSQLELAKQRLEFNGQLLGSLASAPPEQLPALYASARRKAIEFGTLQPDDPEYPEQWTPEIMQFIQRDLTNNLSAKEQLDRLDDAAIDRFLAEQQAQEGGVEHEQNRQPAYSEDSIRAALAMGDGPTVEAANVLRAHGKPFEGSSDEQFRATRKGTTEDITPDGKRPPEYADADKLRRKASNLERQAQQLLTMRGGEKDAAELRQMAAQYRTEAHRMDERSWKERERLKPQAGAPGVTFDESTGSYYENGKPIDAARVQEIADRNKAAGATKFQLKLSEEVNKDFLNNEFRPSVTALDNARISNDRIKAWRNNPISSDTGWGTETKAGAARVLAALGVKDASKYAANAEMFQAQVMQRVFEILGAQKGVQTEGDADRARQTLAALGNRPEANAFLLDLAQATNNLAIEKGSYYLKNKKRAQDSGDLGALETEWYEASKDKSIWNDPVMKKWRAVPGTAAPAAPRQTATNPQTGQQLFWDGTKWQPIK